MSTTDRGTKFRQAAFVYLHVAMLIDLGVYVMWRAGHVGNTPLGPAWLWIFLLVPLIVGLVFLGLYWWQNPWLARVVWVLQWGRLSSLIRSAFVVEVGAPMPPAFYTLAILLVTANLWMLARAAWDL